MAKDRAYKTWSLAERKLILAKTKESERIVKICNNLRGRLHSLCNLLNHEKPDVLGSKWARIYELVKLTYSRLDSLQQAVCGENSETRHLYNGVATIHGCLICQVYLKKTK